MKKKTVLPRHKFFTLMARPIAFILALKFHYKRKKFKISGQNYLILSNHQTIYDPIFLNYTVNTPVYFMASEHIFNKGFISKALSYSFAPIKKKKGTIDISCLRSCMNIAKEKGNICIFPEGNRSWADFQFFISSGISKLVRTLNLPILIFNFKGGYGVNPRWGNKIRKGKFTGEVTQIITLNQIKKMDDETLYNTIKNGIKVVDGNLNNKYKSKRKAEYLERELFICPCCHKMNTMHSSYNSVICSNCHLDVNYNEDLSLSAFNNKFFFKTLLEWYNFQVEEIKKYEVVKNQIIFEDSNINLYNMNQNPKEFLAFGKMTLSDKELIIDKKAILLEDIDSFSIIGGEKITLNTKDDSFLIIGSGRFNPIKYLLMFNKLIPKFIEKGDDYYGLTIHY